MRLPPKRKKPGKSSLQVKKEIEGGTITFAAAANKYSQDEANSGGAGGDLDYFTLEPACLRSSLTSPSSSKRA